MATVATRWTASRNKLFTPEGHATVAPVAGLQPDLCLINKHSIYTPILLAEIN